MQTSVFKSTSRGPNSSTTATTTTTTAPKSTQKGPLRRSRSVSVFSRTHLDLTSDFHNKRDNPLFWVEGSPTSDGETEVKLLKLDEIYSKLNDPLTLKSPDGVVVVGGGGSGESRRGRSVSRNSGGERTFSGGGSGSRKDFGRSLSRVDTGRRRRSPSRGHYGNSESEKDQENAVLSKHRNKSKIGSNVNHCFPAEKSKLARSTSDLSEVLKGWNTWSSQHPALETSDDSELSLSGSRIPHWDDVRSTSFISEAKEKTIKPVSEKKTSHVKEDTDTTGEILETVRTEVRRAISDMQHDIKHANTYYEMKECISDSPDKLDDFVVCSDHAVGKLFMQDMLRSNSDFTGRGIPCDIAPELENPNALEFMTDIRGEFAKELEECEERTRKLRAELAAEELRELELSKILSDIIPEPKTPQVKKPHPVRKASLERRKMSRRLEEEAMAYFDECVSISTFDDSDFSLEEPPSTVVRFSDPCDENATFLGAPSRANVVGPFESQDLSKQSQLVQCSERSSLSANSSCDDLPRTNTSNVAMKPLFSFSSKPSSSSTSLERDIRNYVKNFSKDSKGRDVSKSETVNSSVHHQKTQDFTSKFPEEKFLVDRMNFRSRIESGSMLLCGGNFGFPVAPFSSSLW